MKHNLNVIQIRGFRGILIAVSVVCCLTAGFVVFPGWIAMHVWNKAAQLFGTIPVIGIVQGVLLWGIIIASYFTFKKNPVIICLKTPEGLSEEELKAVFEHAKDCSKEDLVLKSMLKAREAELRLNKKFENNSNGDDSEDCVSELSTKGDQK